MYILNFVYNFQDSNVILIDTQKADVLFALLRKLTETGFPLDNGKNDKTNKTAKTSETAQSSQDDVESIAKRDKITNVVHIDTYVSPSKAKLSTKHKQTAKNKLKHSEKEEIDKLFSYQENKAEVSIVIEDETPEGRDCFYYLYIFLLHLLFLLGLRLKYLIPTHALCYILKVCRCIYLTV